MSKPILKVTITTVEEKSTTVQALIDSGSFYTIIRQDVLPKGTPVIVYKVPRKFKTAAKRGKIKIAGETSLIILIGDRMINDRALVSPDLNRELLVGAGTMQMWDITIRNRKGKTRVVVGRDMRDPEITEVD